MTPRDKWINWGLFILLALIWGSSFILMKVGRTHLNGLQIGSLRILSAGVVFLPFALFQARRIPRARIPLLLLSGLLGNLFPAFLFAAAIDRIDSSLEGILNSLTPLFVIVVGLLFFGMKLGRRQVAGVLIGFIGLVLLSLYSGFNASNFGYAALVLLATLMYGINVNIVNRYLRGLDPIAMATVSLSLMAIPAAIVVGQQEVFSMLRYDEGALLSIGASVLLGIVGSAIATALFYLLIKRAGALFASLVTYAIPIVAIGWGLLDGEGFTLVQGGCLAVILAGVYLVNKK
ncbi:DMT family transporter [Flaviaesturariibacter aridisoli]|uniref:DMT family transporter n=1 Tax=Flaviaesturariibacter aridisoli TaxID=2545761 RepID=A0A4R4E6G6_9BACT|nr:DMT family transporter [Flaviaesturariibacter aridisoli]TCZ73621.1 DMT family transporter [Flaviaesturariibacter aridisoli]